MDRSKEEEKEEDVSSYWMTFRKVKEEALAHSPWRTHFRRG
jgi:hypothetical protein